MVKLPGLSLVSGAIDAARDLADELFGGGGDAAENAADADANPQAAEDFEQATNGDLDGPDLTDDQTAEVSDAESPESESPEPAESPALENPFPGDPRIGPDGIYLSGYHRVAVPLPKKCKSVAVILFVQTQAGTWQSNWSVTRSYMGVAENAGGPIHATSDQFGTLAAAAIEALDDMDSWWCINSSSDDFLAGKAREAIAAFRGKVEVNPEEVLSIAEPTAMEAAPAVQPSVNGNGHEVGGPPATAGGGVAVDGEAESGEEKGEGEGEGKGGGEVKAPAKPSQEPPAKSPAGWMPYDIPIPGNRGTPVSPVAVVQTHEYLVAISDHHEAICAAREELRTAESEYADAKETAKEARKAWEAAVERLAKIIDDKPSLMPLFDGPEEEKAEPADTPKPPAAVKPLPGQKALIPDLEEGGGESADPPADMPDCPMADPPPPAGQVIRPVTVMPPIATRAFLAELKNDIIDSNGVVYGHKGETTTAYVDESDPANPWPFLALQDANAEDGWVYGGIEAKEYREVKPEAKPEPPPTAKPSAGTGSCNLNPSGDCLFPPPPLPNPAQFAKDGKWENLGFDSLVQFGLRQIAVDALEKSRASNLGELKAAMDNSQTANTKVGRQWWKGLGVRANYREEIEDSLGRLVGAAEGK